MRSLWIETLAYVGRCRREQDGLRIFERRRSAAGGDAPSLKTLSRQLRMTELSHANQTALSQFRLRLGAAHELALEHGRNDCAEVLAPLLRAINSGSDMRLLNDQASESLARAAALIA